MQFLASFQYEFNMSQPLLLRVRWKDVLKEKKRIFSWIYPPTVTPDPVLVLKHATTSYWHCTFDNELLLLHIFIAQYTDTNISFCLFTRLHCFCLVTSLLFVLTIVSCWWFANLLLSWSFAKLLGGIKNHPKSSWTHRSKLILDIPLLIPHTINWSKLLTGWHPKKF